MKDRTEGITRVSVDLTLAQRKVVDRLLEQASEAASQATGLNIQVSSRQFFHSLLRERAEAIGIDWPDDYPERGGWRGGDKR